MIDFKILVKVDPSNPEAAIAKLGEKVVNNEKAFASVDRIWAAKQDYLTALPVAVALTVEMRAVVQANSPETKFIVTGVTAENVKVLKEEFGYTVLSTVEVPVKEEKKDVESAGQSTDGNTVKYYYNGKEVSEKEWSDYRKKFLNNWNQVWKDFGNNLLNLL